MLNLHNKTILESQHQACTHTQPYTSHAQWQGCSPFLWMTHAVGTLRIHVWASVDLCNVCVHVMHSAVEVVWFTVYLDEDGVAQEGYSVFFVTQCRFRTIT